MSHPNFEEQMEVVKQTLHEIGAQSKPVIIVFNKIDCLPSEHRTQYSDYETDESKIDQLKRTWMAKNNAPMLFISAAQKINMDEFRKELVNQVKKLIRPY